MTGEFLQPPSEYLTLLYAEAARQVALNRYALAQGVEAVTGDRTRNPLEVFPTAAEVRQDSAVALSAEQLAALQPVAASMDIGEKRNRTLADRGIPGAHHAILEGGLAHKIIAEAFVAAEDANAVSITFTASKEVKITDAQYKTLMNFYNLTPEDCPDPAAVFGATEYDMAHYIGTHLPGVTPVAPKVHAFGYSVDRERETVDELSTGELQTIAVGRRGKHDIPVRIFEVKRHWYEEDGKRKYRQPQTDGVVKLLHEAFQRDEDGFRDATTPFGHYSTPTYPSRGTGLMIAALQTGRRMGVATAGADYIAMAKGESAPASQDAALEKLMPQVPAEFNVIALKTGELEAALAQKASPLAAALIALQQR